jgi:hypothetical protein
VLEGFAAILYFFYCILFYSEFKMIEVLSEELKYGIPSATTLSVKSKRRGKITLNIIIIRKIGRRCADPIYLTLFSK